MDAYSLIINTKENVIYVPHIEIMNANVLSKQKNYLFYLDNNKIYYDIYIGQLECSMEKLVVYDMRRHEGIRNVTEKFMYINDEKETINIEVFNSEKNRKFWISLKPATKGWEKIIEEKHKNNIN